MKNIITKAKEIRREILYYIHFGYRIKQIRKKHKKVYIFANSAVHGNMGDQALGFCGIELLKRCGINEEAIIEYTSRDKMRYWHQICKNHSKNDIIILRGGGYWGDLWIDGFSVILDYLEQFKNNKIVILPQSVFFSNTIEGDDFLERSKKVISECSDIYIFARDKISQGLLEEYYPNRKIYVSPDTVLSYLPMNLSEHNRKGVLLCLRNDKEKKLNIYDDVINILNNNEIEYKSQDTNIDYNMKNLCEREPKLRELWLKFANSKLVITDRLHGMIFSAITATPCIVFDNIDGKVGNQYEWLKKLQYIKYLDSTENIDKVITKFMKMGGHETEYPLNTMIGKFEELEFVLRNI